MIIRIILLCVTLSFESNVLANSNGIYNSTPSNSSNCFSCHGTNFNYSTLVTGPNTVAPGGSETYTIALSKAGGANASRYGFSLEASSGSLTAGTGSKVDPLDSKDLTHNARSSTGSWAFTWNAPSTVGIYNFSYCGNPVDNAVNGSSGDGSSNVNACRTTDVTVNSAPSAVNDLVNHSEDGGSDTISPLSNDSAGGSGDTKTLVGICSTGTGVSSCTSSSYNPGSPGSLSVSGNNVTYSPASNYNGSFSFQYRMRDSLSLYDNATVTVTVSAQNDDPVITQGASSTVNMSEDSSPTPFSLTLSATDPDVGATFAWSILTSAGNGSATATGSGSSKPVSYTPTANYHGADSFVVRVTDNTGRTDDITVNVNVASQNDTPVITEGASTTVNMSEDSSPTPFSLTLNATDSDAGATFTWSLLTPAAHGSATASGSGSSQAIAYTPTANYHGADSFVVRVMDNTGRTDDITVNVNIASQNDAPVVTEGASTTVNMSEDSSPTPFSLTLNATDSDAGATFTWSLLTPAVHGSATASGSGSSQAIAYTPTANYNGTDSFVVQVTDNTGLTDDIAVNVNISAQNDSPTAIADTSLSVNEDTSNNSLDVLNNDTDADLSQEGDSRQIIALCSAATASAANCTANNYNNANGAVTLSAVTVNNTALFTPTPNYSGPFSFKYKMQDTSAVVSMALVSVTVLPVSDTTPVANAESISLNEGATAVSLVGGATSVLSNDTGLTDTPITLVKLTDPTYAAVFSFNHSDGTFSYQHNGSENFTDNFSYRITDLDGGTDTAIVSISVTPVSDATPVVVADTINVIEGGTATTVAEGGGQSSVLANDTGLLDAPTLVTIVTPPVFASSFSLNTDGTFSYTHNGSENFTDGFTYRITDNDGQLSTGSVSIAISKISDSTPMANSDAITVSEGGTVTTMNGGVDSVMANDAGLLDTPVVVSLKTGPSQANSFNLNSDGTFSYVHNGGDVHSDSFVYTLTDNDGQRVDGTVNIVITNINDAPVALADHSFVNVLEDSSNNLLDVLANDTDSDVGDTKRIVALCAKGTADAACTAASYAPASGTVTLSASAVNNHVIFNPALNANGLFEFKYKMQDTGGLTDYAEASVTVTAVNDAPLISSTSPSSVIELAQYQYQVAVIDPDDSGTGLQYSLIDAPSGMAVTLNGGLITWTPEQNTANTYSFSVQVEDGRENAASPAIETIALTVSTADRDADTIADYDDNCPNTPNTDQANNDSDSQGDLCDTDDDNDTMLDTYEITHGLDPFSSADAALDSDGDGLTNAQEAALGSNPNADTVPPVIVASAINVNATGILTAVEFFATATDAFDGVVNPSTSSDTGPFLSGSHSVSWRAVDQAGNIATLDQTINIAPLVSVAASQISGEGQGIDVTVMLSGPAASYPVDIDYLITGSAEQPADHNLTSGSVSIVSGLEANIPLTIVGDALTEGNEEIILTLSTANNAIIGEQNKQTISIVEQQVAPSLSLSAVQNTKATAYIYKDQGTVIVTAAASDANGDTITYDWSAVSGISFSPVPTTASMAVQFDPSMLDSGLYRIPVSISDGTISVSSTIHLLLAETAQLLTGTDSDGDGIADNTEGAGDSDADLLPDYLDPIDQSNLISTFVSPQENSYLNIMQTELGLSVKLGRNAIASRASGTQVSVAEVSASSPGVNLTDLGYTQISSLFDFEIHGLNSVKNTAKLVIPLSLRLPANAVYRKYEAATGWSSFVEDSQNTIKSANSNNGICPGVMDMAYKAGLQLLADCIELTFSDGGPNDADGLVNGVIVDPGGISIPDSTTPNELIEAKLIQSDDSVSAGGSSAFNMIFLGLLLLIGLFPITNKNKK